MRRIHRLAFVVLVVLGTQSGIGGQGRGTNAPAVPDPGRDWTYHGGDPGGARFSTLTQINAGNVKGLTRAWTFRTGATAGTFEATPLVIDSVMYVNAVTGIYALDAVTGTQIWKYDAEGASTRGAEYWPGGNGRSPRLFTRTSAGLVALDAKTGEPAGGFGVNGVVAEAGTSTSPPSIHGNLVFTQDNGPYVRAWDAVTGKAVWRLDLIAQPGDPNNATWLNNSWNAPVGGTDVWGLMTVDTQRGLLFAPVSKAGNDYWGGPNPGNNLYSDCLIAIDVATGKMKWYQQLTHHDIWDFDLGAPPVLVEVRRNGQTIPGVAQITKMGLLFVFNRETGEPMYGMEERAVPQTKAPGEWTSPTQPFPLKPAPLARMSMTKADLAKVTPEHEAFCAGLWEKYDVADAAPYEPWRTDRVIAVFPGALGGGNWGGVTFHRTLGLMITNIHNTGQWGKLEPATAGGGRRGGGRGAPGGAAGGQGAAGAAGAGAAGTGRQGAPAGSGAAAAGAAGAGANVTPPGAAAPTAANAGLRKVTPEGGRFWDPNKRWNCAAPPWGELIAVNANTGDIAWRVPLGTFDELEAKGIKTGTPQLGGAITTAGNLVFIGATIDSKFRAFDVRTGAELWSVTVDAPAHSVPSTYMGRNGKQYVVVAAGGRGFLGSPGADTLIAFALP